MLCIAKKVGSIIKRLPSTEKIILTYIDTDKKTYVISHNQDRSKYFLYLKEKNGLKLLETRKDDPFFKVAYPEMY